MIVEWTVGQWMNPLMYAFKVVLDDKRECMEPIFQPNSTTNFKNNNNDDASGSSNYSF